MGVAGLGGLFGTLKDIIDLFALFKSSANLGHEFELLDIKLEIEKALLLQWSERVGLLRSDHDERLDDPDTQALVVRTLSCIRTLLETSAAVQERYDPSSSGPNDQSSLQESNRQDGIGQRRMELFIQRFKTISQRGGKKDEGHTIRTRARWAVNDKDKFGELVKDLSHLVAKLNELVPAVDIRRQSCAMADEDLEPVRDAERLNLLLEASSGFESTIADSTRRAIILAKLWFRRMEDRRESIEEAHQDTFQWILRDSSSGSSNDWNHLSTWLPRGPNGIYWVSGKAGSGKSTLMKYLLSHHRLPTLLRDWAGASPLWICNYFFASMGNQEQKSQEGLSRTLLHQILDKNRQLIPTAFPHMWKEISKTNRSPEPPTTAELRLAFNRIAQSTRNLGKFCIFVDGLDEFVGDYSAGIKFLQTLAKNKHFKVIVSSRPIPECFAAFNKGPKLRLQDLTRNDIRSYVDDTLNTHAYMKKLINRHAQEAVSIIKEIVDKASGVFLWVILACRSLLMGFSHYDNLEELRSRVDALPPELGEMFLHMLKSTNPRYSGQGLRLLKVCHTHLASTSRHQGPCWKDTISALSLAVVEDSNFSSLHFEDLTIEEMHEFIQQLEGRLRSRCGGLLEIYSFEVPGLHNSSDATSEQQLKYRLTMDTEVRFMHRSVGEFLAGDETPVLGCDNETHVSVEMSLSLYWQQLAALLGHRIRAEDTAQLRIEFMAALWLGLLGNDRAGAHEAREVPALLADFRTIVKSFSETAFAQTLSDSLQHADEFAVASLEVILATRIGQPRYALEHPRLGEVALHDRSICGCPPIHTYIISSMDYFPGSTLNQPMELVQALLSLGYNPNEPFLDIHLCTLATTFWEDWLSTLSIMVPFLGRLHSLLLQTTEQFLLCGAQESQAEDRIRQAFSKMPSHYFGNAKARGLEKELLKIVWQFKGDNATMNNTKGKKRPLPEEFTEDESSRQCRELDFGELALRRSFKA